MGRLSAAIRWWERLDRRALPATTPRPLVYTIIIGLLGLLAWNLVRDIRYLLTIPIDDVRAYECYARAFWRGPHALVDAPSTRHCAEHAFRFWVAPPRAFHTMPREYPAPALMLFSLPLLMPFQHYNMAFMEMMAALTFAVTAWLAARGQVLGATAFALYVLVAGWATTLARYDLAPGLLVLGALLLAERRLYSAAYVLLAAGTLLKVYPVFLAPVLAAQQWRATGQPPRRDLAIYAAIVAVGLLPGALLDPANFLQPLGYNSLRPPQIESVAGSLLWLSGRVGGDVHVRLTYHSLNVTGSLGALTAWAATLALLGGLVLVCRRAWHGEDALGRSFVLALLVTLCGSKLLSPQYLLWLLPVAAHVEGLRARWMLLAILTVVIYPFAYGFGTSLVRLPDHPIFMGSILSRNAVLVALVVAYLLPARVLQRVYLRVHRGAARPEIPPLRAAARERIV